VKVGLDSLLLQCGRLVRASAGDDRERRLELLNDSQLFLAQLKGDESQNANTPGPQAQSGAGLVKQRLELWCPEQRAR